ncbi:MAG: NUDIX hydrolase [Acidobacteria bacterium]|nr:NUDIX hydrolase [Acidobacteriota bacterium]
MPKQIAAPVKKTTRRRGKAEVLSSKLAYNGKLFKVFKDQVREPGAEDAHLREVIRHNGSVVILAVDAKTGSRDPLIVMERQYRHAAGQFLLEVPAGKMEEGEKRLPAAKRELLEETGFRARKWTKLVRYFASPGFLGEWMQVFLAEELTAGQAAPEADENLEIVMMRLSDVLEMIHSGEILDGKTIVSVLFYARMLDENRKQKRKTV